MSTQAKKPRGGRHWRVNSDPAIFAFGRLLATKKLRNKFSTEAEYLRFYGDQLSEIPPPLKQDVLCNILLYECRCWLIHDQFKNRLEALSRFTVKERMTGRRNQRATRDEIILSDAFWNLIREGYFPAVKDVRLIFGQIAAHLGAIVILLEASNALYKGRFGDPHKLVAMHNAEREHRESMSQNWRALGSKLDPPDLNERAPGPGILDLFPPEYLSRQQGTPSGAARAWIIRRFNAHDIVPACMTVSAGRYATIAELLTLIDIPTTAVLVRSTILRHKA